MSFYASYQKIIKNTRWCPPVISWFINPMNTIVISIINPSYCSYLHQLNANYGAPPCIVVIIVSGCGPFGSFHCQTRPDGPARISPLSFYASYQKIIKNTRWCPPVISWFINPMNTIVISIINPSYCSYLHQLNANYGAPPCIVVIIVSGCGPFGSFHCQTRPDGPARISPLSFYASYQKIIKNTRWCPPVISWFINPMNTIVISIINPSYCSYLHQLNANGGTTL